MMIHIIFNFRYLVCKYLVYPILCFLYLFSNFKTDKIGNKGAHAETQCEYCFCKSAVDVGKSQQYTCSSGFLKILWLLENFDQC